MLENALPTVLYGDIGDWIGNYIPPWLSVLKWVDLGILGVAIAFVALLFLMRVAMPRIGAIAWVTAKESIMQPLFLIILMVGLATLLLFLYIPYNTFGEDIKLVITQGLTVVKLLAIFLGIWSASMTVADELEGKTALMILSKPVGRRSFVIGKYLGVMIPVTILFLILGTFFLHTVSFKVVYDAREAAKAIPDAVASLQMVLSILPGLLLAFFEALILTAIAIAISTRLSLLPNMTICLTIYVIGHLVSLIVQSSVGEIPLVAFVGDLASAILPVLGHFSMETAVAMEKQLPWHYVGYAAVYSMIYCFLALVVSLFLFEDRDLA